MGKKCPGAAFTISTLSIFGGVADANAFLTDALLHGTCENGAAVRRWRAFNTFHGWHEIAGRRGSPANSRITCRRSRCPYPPPASSGAPNPSGPANWPGFSPRMPAPNTSRTASCRGRAPLRERMARWADGDTAAGTGTGAWKRNAAPPVRSASRSWWLKTAARSQAWGW